MESLGFQVGQSIIRKDRSQAVIESFQGEMVTMKTDHGQSKINYQTFLDGEWTKFNPKLPDEYLDDLHYYSPLQHQQSWLEYFKSCFLLEMRQQYHLHKGMEDLVVIRLKPKNGLDHGSTSVGKALCHSNRSPGAQPGISGGNGVSLRSLYSCFQLPSFFILSNCARISWAFS